MGEASIQANHVLRLGPYRFDLRAAQLQDAAGRRITLRPQAASVLEMLARKPGELVTKSALMQAVWPEVVVTDDSLVQCVSELRRALHDDEHRIIQTVSRRGYCLRSAAPPEPGVEELLRDEASFHQEIRFAGTRDDVRIAYAVAGRGYPVVRTAHWMTHLEWDWRSAAFGPRIRVMAEKFQYWRYDGRGWGLSDRDCVPGQLDDWVLDLEAVVDAEGLQRFALFGPSAGAAIALRYAARHPERVSHIVLLGGLVRGSRRRGERSTPKPVHEAFLRLVEEGWGAQNDAFRQLMTSMLWPSATAEVMQSFNHLQRMASSARTAAAMLDTIAHLDVLDEVSAIKCPTLVLHSLHDVRIPFEEGRLLASHIPGARLEPFDSPNHTPLLDEPEFMRLHRLICEFVSP